MPKSKRAKTHHQRGQKDLSQAEIWDDSALIRSWNDAVTEYEYYHSIHAKGEDVEEVLRKAEIEEAHGNMDHSAGVDDVAEEGQFEDGEIGEEAGKNGRSFQPRPSSETTFAEPRQPALGPVDLPPERKSATVPLATDTSQASMQDQTLENIKMAYYWAGYYSGLYDGQRQAQAQAQVQGQSQDQHESQP